MISESSVFFPWHVFVSSYRLSLPYHLATSVSPLSAHIFPHLVLNFWQSLSRRHHIKREGCLQCIHSFRTVDRGTYLECFSACVCSLRIWTLLGKDSVKEDKVDWSHGWQIMWRWDADNFWMGWNLPMHLKCPFQVTYLNADWHRHSWLCAKAGPSMEGFLKAQKNTQQQLPNEDFLGLRFKLAFVSEANRNAQRGQSGD